MAILKAPGGTSLALRPGAMCSLLGMCSPAANCSLADPVASPAAGRFPLSLCSSSGTANGLAGSARAAGSRPDPPLCVAASDCAAGSLCIMLGGACDFRVCDPGSGVDVCKPVGNCTSVCDTPAVVARVADSLKRAPPCTTDADCTDGNTCRDPPSGPLVPPCRRVVCANGTEGAVPCTKICRPASPAMVNASIMNDGTSIKANIFDAPTTTAVGQSALCDAAGSTLTVAPSGDVRLVPGNTTLALRVGQAWLVSALDPTNQFAGALPRPVATCSACPSPTARVQGPPRLADPCVGSGAAAPRSIVIADASGSSDASGRRLASLVWALVGAQDPVLSGLVNDTNNKANSWDAYTLSVNASRIKDIAAGTYTLRVTATNIFGLSTNATFTFDKETAATVPAFVLDRSFATVMPSKPLRLAAKVLPGRCAGGEIVWSWSSTLPGLDLSSAATPSLFLKGGLTGIAAGQAFTFSVSAGYRGANTTASDSVTLTAIGAPLAPALSGPSGTVRAANVTFSAARSLDPDDPHNAASPMGFLWSCGAAANGGPCFTAAGYQGVQDGSEWRLDLSMMAPDKDYIISVTVVKGSGDYARSATASLEVTPRTVPIPTGRIERSCGYDPRTQAGRACMPLHNPSEPLTLVAIPDAGSPAPSWSYDPTRTPGGLTLGPATTAGGTNRRTVTILPAGLPAAGSVTVVLQLEQEGQVGRTSATIGINSPPVCTVSAGCLTVDAPSQTFPATFELRGVAGGWVDPDGFPLTYEFGVDSGGVRSARGSDTSPSFTFRGLATGNTTLYMCAIDTNGARACGTLPVQVLDPPAAQKAQVVAAALQSVAGSVSAASDACDASQVTSAALQIASILALSAPAPGAPGGDGSAAAADALNGTQNTLVQAMAAAGRSAGGDPDVMNPMLAAGAALSAAADLSPSAGAALLDLFDSTLSADAEAGRGLGPAQLAEFASALAEGLSAAAAAPPPAAASRRRRLLTDGAAMTPGAVYAALASGADGLSSALLAGAALDAAAVVAGGADVCVAAALLNAAAVDGAQVALNCAGISAAAKITMPANFSGPCLADAACAAAAPVALQAAYFSPDSPTGTPAAIMAVLESYPSAVGINRVARAVTLVTGVIKVTSSYTAGASPARLCPSGAAGCVAALSLPLSAAFVPPSANASLLIACVRLAAPPGDTSGEALASSDDSADVVTAGVSGNSVVCKTAEQGMYAAFQYYNPTAAPERSSPPPSASPSASPPAASPSPSPAAAESNDTAAASPSPSPAASPGAASPSPSPAASPEVEAPATFSEAAVDGNVSKPFTFTFALSWQDLSSNATRLEDFKLDLRRSFIEGVERGGWGVGVRTASGDLELSRVTVTSVREGSVVAVVSFLLPAGATDAQAAELVTLVTSNPQALLAGSTLAVSVLSAEPAPAASGGGGGLRGSAVAGIVVGSVVGAAALAGCAMIVLARARRTVGAGGKASGAGAVTPSGPSRAGASVAAVQSDGRPGSAGGVREQARIQERWQPLG